MMQPAFPLITDELVERIKPFCQAYSDPRAFSVPSAASAHFSEISKEYKEPVLVSGTDGVGTKLMLAFKLNRHDTVGGSGGDERE